MANLTKEGWVDFTPLTDKVIEMYPQRVLGFLGKDIRGTRGETAPFRAYRSKEIQLGIQGNPIYPIGYVQVGNLALLDSCLKEHIPQSLQSEYQEHLIWLWQAKSLLWEPTAHLQYSSLAIHSLDSLDLRGKHVVDLGSADGALSLVARKKGAQRVTSVELMRDYERVFRNHLIANDLSVEGMDYVVGSFKDRGVQMFLMSQQADVVISNIGPYYGTGHLDAIELGTQIPKVQTYIDGAYVKGHPHYDPGPSIELLARNGFNTNYRELTYNTYCLAYMVNRGKVDM